MASPITFGWNWPNQDQLTSTRVMGCVSLDIEYTANGRKLVNSQ